jgi:hypothetical protein
LNPDVYKSKKRTYDLVTNNSTERPTVDDQRAAFKKLIRNSEFWYDRTIQGKLEPRSKEDLRKDMRKSCPNCGNPLEEKISVKKFFFIFFYFSFFSFVFHFFFVFDFEKNTKRIIIERQSERDNYGLFKLSILSWRSLDH